MHLMPRLTVTIIVSFLKITYYVLAQGEDAKSETTSYKIEPLPDSFAAHGEAPHWEVDTQSLYFVDTTNGKLLRYDYEENKVYRSKIIGEELASVVIPVEGTSDKFAVGCERRMAIIQWDGKSTTCNVDRILFEVETEEKFNKNRFNDAKCDPRGRLFAGTMTYIGDEFAHRLGELYKYEEGGNVELMKQDIGLSNGLAWNEAEEKFYYIDTNDFEVKVYDYDLENGVFSNENIAFDLHTNSSEDNIKPDGMTIDTEGNIYVASFNGYRVFKVDPRTNQVLLEIEFSCKQVTSAAWGGPNLDILYVTTSNKNDEPPPCGTTYKVTDLNAKGYPMIKLKI